MHFIIRHFAAALILLVFVTASRAQEIQSGAPATDVNAGGKMEQKLPPPLDAITYDLGVLTEHFKVVECKLYGESEFTAGDRVVAEETVAWTLAAKRAMTGDAVFRLLHPNPFPNSFAKVRFEKSVDGKSTPADARPHGYTLIRDLRWINLKTAPDLAAGDKLQVWIHLGQEGNAGLLEKKATRMVIVSPKK